MRRVGNWESASKVIHGEGENMRGDHPDSAPPDEFLRDSGAEDTDGPKDASGAEDTDGDAVAQAPAVDAQARQDEVNSLRTKWLRALADLDNYKKRVEREKARWTAEAREEVLLSLLDLADDFERAIASGRESGVPPDDPFRAGVEMILERLRGILRKYDVTPIETEGAGFDPSLHEAVAHVDSDQHGADEIVEEVRKGYKVGDRLLRCSRVVVAK